MPASPKQESGTAPPRRLLVWLLLLVVPLVAVGPALMPGKRLLSQLPVAFPPLAAEYPIASANAIEGMNYSTSDRLYPVLTDQLEARRQLATGTLPTWDPHLGAGVPLFAGSIAGLAYPPNWFGLIFAPDRAAAYLALLSLFLAGLGMWLLLSAKGFAPEAALAGALLMQASLWGFTNLHDYMKVDAALWTPWLLYGIERVRAGQRRGLLTIALAGGLSLLAGFYPIAIFGFITAGLYALGVFIRAPRELGRVVLALLLALGIGAWQVLPALEASEHSLRQSGGAASMAAQALPPATTAALFVPDLFGAPDQIATSTYDPAAAALVSAERNASLAAVNALEWNLHFGSLALLLGLVGLIACPRRAAAPALLLVFWFGFAQAWPGFGWLYHLPGFDLGAPGRALAMAWPLFAWLGATGVQALAAEAAHLRAWRAPTATHRRRHEGVAPGEREPIAATLAATLIGLLAMTLALIGWQLLDPQTIGHSVIEHIAARHGYPLGDVAALVPEASIAATAARIQASLGAWFATGLLLTAAAVFARAVAGRTLMARGTLAMALALAIALAPRLASGAFELAPDHTALITLAAAFVGLCLLHSSTLLARDIPEWAHPGWQHNALALILLVGLVVETLDVAPRHLAPREVQPDSASVVSASSRAVPLFPPSLAMDAISQTIETSGRVLRVDASPAGVQEVVQLARPNTLGAYGIRDLTPYIVFTPRTLIELVTQGGAGRAFRSGITAVESYGQANQRILDLLRVTTVLSTRELDNPRAASGRERRDLEPIWSQPGFHVYRRPGALPVALLVPRATIAASDQAALEHLASPAFNPRAEVVLAPGTELPDGAQLETGPDELLEVTVRRPSASRIDVQVRTGAGGWLLITEQFMPDWKVNIDGVDAVMLRADHALRALWIPPGEHTVRTWYEPWSLRYGFTLMLLSLGVAGLLTWRERT